ncbi:hypothetical protein VTH06DRAFT_4703 [Thermothelomyces fergusii]
MRVQIAALLALAAPLFAIEITSPSKDEVVDPAKGVTVEWKTVSTDPDRAHLVLVNMAGGHTPFTKDLGEVDLSRGSITVKVEDVPSDTGYQFNFQSNEPQNTGILAQSAQFEVSSSDDDDDDDDDDAQSSTTASPSSTSSPTSSSSSSSPESTATSAFASTTTESLTSAATTLVTSATSSASDATSASSATSSPSSVSSTGAAAPTGMPAHGGSLFALMVGVAAVLA